jgi:hypothetical protein
MGWEFMTPLEMNTYHGAYAAEVTLNGNKSKSTCYAEFNIVTLPQILRALASKYNN